MQYTKRTDTIHSLILRVLFSVSCGIQCVCGFILRMSSGGGKTRCFCKNKLLVLSICSVCLCVWKCSGLWVNLLTIITGWYFRYFYLAKRINIFILYDPVVWVGVCDLCFEVFYCHSKCKLLYSLLKYLRLGGRGSAYVEIYEIFKLYFFKIWLGVGTFVCVDFKWISVMFLYLRNGKHKVFEFIYQNVGRKYLHKLPERRGG